MLNSVMLELTRISQKAAQAATSETQVQVIVDEIRTVIEADVCSLYLQDLQKNMVLMASHGLATHHPVVIPKGKGLVGKVAQACHTINIVEPEQHPDYYFVPLSQEEQFHSFCGVPLVQRGEVIGVLVVQTRRAEVLGIEQEAFVTTLASHLALLVLSLPKKNAELLKRNQRYRGISGAAGIAIAELKLNQSEQLSSVTDSKTSDIELELAQWEQLRCSVISELKAERRLVEKAMGESLAAVLDAYWMLLDDPTFIGLISGEIKAGKSLLTAIKYAVQFFSSQFKAMDDPYLRSRHEDIEQLGDKLYQAWLGVQVAPQGANIHHPLILIGDHISVSDIVSLPSDKLMGIVCFSGAALSHIAVFANALGIPAVMGVGTISHIVAGERAIVDGNTGQLILNPSEILQAEYQAILSSHQEFNQSLQGLSALPAITLDGTSFQLMANSGLQADIMPGLRNGADGIGLYRTEIPFMARQSLPSEEDQVAVYQRVFDAYGDHKPIYIRTLDIGGDKPLPYLPAVEEDNPALGWRGIRFTLDNVQLLMTQLRAMIRAGQGRENLHILLPMVSATEELDQCIRLLDAAYQQLVTEGFSVFRPKLGIMVEVPGTVALLKFWHAKIDFISIGTNDLSQYLLAVDRNNPLVGKRYDSLHPAVVSELQRIIQTANTYHLPMSLCGEMASDPVAVLLLAGLGVRRLSMSSAKLPFIKWLLRSINIEDAKQFAEQALRIDNANDIRLLGQSLLNQLGIDIEHPSSLALESKS